MSTSVRFPVGFPLPTRDDYSDGYELTRTRSEMEVGRPRQRRNRTVAPKEWDISFELKQSKFAVFEDWFVNDIDQGAIPFDIQLSDDAEGIVWYTCYWIGGFKYTVNNTNPDDWTITGHLRSILPSFATRSPGTDELYSVAKGSNNITVSRYNAGHFQVPNGELYSLARQNVLTLNKGYLKFGKVFAKPTGAPTFTMSGAGYVPANTQHSGGKGTVTTLNKGAMA